MYQHDRSTFDDRVQSGGKVFRRLHHVSWGGKFAFAAFLVMTGVYFAYRLPLWNPGAPILSGLLLFAELFGVMTLLLHVFATWTLVERSAPPAPLDYTTDIFITTWNEAPQLLRQTLVAAKQVRRARHVWLLDDGCRPEMEQLASDLGVRYVARADRSHAKAGNLNNALQHSDAEFIALFDSDHAPGPEFLERTLGHFIDPRIAFVQTPQDFYNIDSFQHRSSGRTREAWHEQTLFYRVIQAGKDRWNATFFCGSCAILRRSALDDIGGFATGTITEDMHTSLRMHKKGWSAVYHAEALAFGLSPVNFEQYETQRLRWGRGAMQVWAKEGILSAKGLTLAQRLAYFTSAVTYFEGWQKAIIYTLPMIVLVTGSMPLIDTGWTFALMFGLWLSSGLLVNEIFSRGYAKVGWMEEYNFIRYFTFIKATLTLVVPRKLGFLVTPKRMQSDFKETIRLWPQLLIVLSAVASGLIGTYLFFTTMHLPGGAFAANLLWLIVNTAFAIKALAFVAKKMRQRRSDHRFSLPVVARISLNCVEIGTTITSIAEDISSEGMSIALPGTVAQGARISGTLLLPSGPLPFQGIVQHCDPNRTGVITPVGVRFEWAEAAAADALSQYLYGNTLQWDVNALAEVSGSSLIRSLLARVKRPRLPGAWNHTHVSGDGRTIDCLTRTEGEYTRLVSYSPLPAQSDLTLAMMNDDELSGLHVIGYREYPVGAGSVYLAVLAAKKTVGAKFHREPRWTSVRDLQHG